MTITIDRLDYFEGYIKYHRNEIIKDLAKEESRNNKIINLINEVRLQEMDHLLDCIEDINKKTVDTNSNNQK